MKRNAYTFYACLLSSFLICCSIPLSVTAAETKKITFGYSTIGAMATGVWMAKEIGAFEKYGIQADLIFISSGPVVVQALIGGDLHGGVAASNAVINAISNGAPIIGVAGTANRPYHRLWVQPEINRLEDLRGDARGCPLRRRYRSSDEDFAPSLWVGRRCKCAPVGRSDGDRSCLSTACNHRGCHSRASHRCQRSVKDVT